MKKTSRSSKKARREGGPKMSRRQFLAGVGGAALGIGLLDMVKTAKAQIPPPSQGQLLTLAAFVDTVIPTYPQEDFVVQSPAGPLPDHLPSVGAYETQTKGAVDFPNSYMFLYYVLPQAAHRPQIVDELKFALDKAAKEATQNPNAEFWMLNYYARYVVVYSLDDTYALVNKLIGMGYSVEGAFDEALMVKRLLTVSIFGTYLISYSELVNVYPKGTVGGLPYFARNEDRSWDIIPDSMWDQMGYPGPSYKEPSYASEYDGLRVTIADGKVKFEDKKAKLKGKAKVRLSVRKPRRKR